MEEHRGLPQGQRPGGWDPLSDDPTAADPRLEGLLAALAAPHDAGQLPGEHEALAAFRAHAESTRSHPSRRTRMLAHLTTAKVAAAAFAGGLVLTGSAAAAAGSLPGAAQQTARDMLATVGVEVPGPDEHAGTHPANGAGTEQSDRGTSGATDHGKGDEVSDVATSTEETGVDKGAAVSDVASDGKSQAGERGSAGDAPDAAESHAPSDTPDGSGTDAPADAPDGASDRGSGTADDASDGRSGAAPDDPGSSPR